MLKKCLLLCLMLSFLVNIGNFIPQTSAQEQIQAFVNVDLLNVRAEPSMAAPILGRLRRGTIVSIHSREGVEDQNGLWLEMSADGVEGWVLSINLFFPSDPNPSNIQAIVATSAANLRLDPDPNSQIRVQLNIGDVVTVRGREIFRWSDTWVLVSTSTQTGWMLATDLQFDSSVNVEQLPITYGVPSSTLVAQVSGDTNLRGEPNSEAPITTAIPEGALVEIHGQEFLFNNGGVWVQITWINGGITGWISRFYLRFPSGYRASWGSPSPCTILDVEIDPVAVQGLVVGRWYSFYHHYTLRLRAEPTTTAAILTEMPHRSLLGVYGYVGQGGRFNTWYYVTDIASGLSGWVAYVSLPIGYSWEQLPRLEPVAYPTLPAATQPAATLSATLSGEAILREQPARCSPIIQRFATGTSVVVLGRTIEGYYFKVSVDGQEGWVYWSDLDIEGDFERLPVLTR